MQTAHLINQERLPCNDIEKESQVKKDVSRESPQHSRFRVINSDVEHLLSPWGISVFFQLLWRNPQQKLLPLVVAKHRTQVNRIHSALPVSRKRNQIHWHIPGGSNLDHFHTQHNYILAANCHHFARCMKRTRTNVKFHFMNLTNRNKRGSTQSVVMVGRKKQLSQFLQWPYAQMFSSKNGELEHAQPHQHLTAKHSHCKQKQAKSQDAKEKSVQYWPIYTSHNSAEPWNIRLIFSTL